MSPPRLHYYPEGGEPRRIIVSRARRARVGGRSGVTRVACDDGRVGGRRLGRRDARRKSLRVRLPSSAVMVVTLDYTPSFSVRLFSRSLCVPAAVEHMVVRRQ